MPAWLLPARLTSTLGGAAVRRILAQIRPDAVTDAPGDEARSQPVVKSEAVGTTRLDLAFVDLSSAAFPELTRREPAPDDRPVAAGQDRAPTEAAAMQGHVTKPVVDRAVYDEQRATFGDARIVYFLSLLTEELARRSAALDDAARLDDRSELGRIAHAIASAAGNLGFVSLMTLCRRLEHEFGTVPGGEIDAVLDELRRAIGVALETVDALCAEIAADAEEAAAPPAL